jgi:two-component system chemotaxis sensor kinase CheA
MDDSGDLFQQMTKGLEMIAEHLEFIREQLPDEFSDLMDEPIQTVFSLMPQKSRKTDQPEPQGISIPVVEKLIRIIQKPFDGEASDEVCREIGSLLSEAVVMVPEPLKKAMEQVQEIFNTFVHSPIGLDNLARESMLDLVRTLRIDDPDSRTESSKSGNEPTEERMQIQKADASAAPGKEKAAGTSKTMRIPEESLDAFLENVGELMGIEEMFRHLYRQLLQKGVTSRFSTDLKQMIDQFGQFSSRLRKGIMDVRKVEAQSLLGKANRIVRDIASGKGKKIAVECSGEKLRIDKSYIELLDAPLVHMVRNAADHGIESPEEREIKGKSPEGIIRIDLQERGNDICLTIADDGRGIDYELISQKAAETIGTNDSVSSEVLEGLIFKSGISTATEVTDISGRGVGLDVVKQTIEQAGGRVDVTNRPGAGCTFTVSLPRSVSTKIMDGYLVRAMGGGVYALPLNLVMEVFAAQASDVTSVAGMGRVVKRRGLIFPVFDLGVLLKEKSCRNGPDSSFNAGELLVLVSMMKKKYAISVQEVIGVQKIVVKPINGICVDQIFEGAAMMGDGSTALIIGEEGMGRIVQTVLHA